MNKSGNIKPYLKLKVFFSRYYAHIILLVFLFMGVSVAFRIYGIDFNPGIHSHIDKIVTVESFNK